MTDAINPNHYKGFSNGAEVIDITENLVTNCGSAVKYLARAGRFDGQVKGEVLEDLKKAAWYVNREIARLERQDATSVKSSGTGRVFCAGSLEPNEPGLVLRGVAVEAPRLGALPIRYVGDVVTLRLESRPEKEPGGANTLRWWCLETDTYREWDSWLAQVDCLVEQ